MTDGLTKSKYFITHGGATISYVSQSIISIGNVCNENDTQLPVGIFEPGG